MKKRSSRTKTKTIKKPLASPPPPEPTAEVEPKTIVDERFPSHEFRMVAEVAARMATGRGSITREEGAKIARNALNLLDGVRDVVRSRDKSRSTILSGLSERAKIPQQLRFAEGKLFILGSDGGGTDARFNDFLKSEIRAVKLLNLRQKHTEAGLQEPTLEEIPETTQQELNARRNRLEKEGFNRSDLGWLKHFYGIWRVSVHGDSRRKKAKKVLGKTKK